jgi:predicted nucleic acid-binding protein
MAKAFVDTASWLALINMDDKFHEKAKAVRTELLQAKTDFVTTDQVLIEVANGLSSPRFRAAAVQLLEAIERSENIRVVRTDQRIYKQAWEMYKRSTDKEWGLTDCISFVVMAEEGIQQAFTTDHHFEQAGFIKLL